MNLTRMIRWYLVADNSNQRRTKYVFGTESFRNSNTLRSSMFSLLQPWRPFDNARPSCKRHFHVHRLHEHVRLLSRKHFLLPSIVRTLRCVCRVRESQGNRASISIVQKYLASFARLLVAQFKQRTK